MCLLFLYINPTPEDGDYKLVLINNRDEFYSRPTQAAHIWESGIIAGMDMEPERKGGTWLGMTKDGRIGCLLNIFQPKGSLNRNGAPRGHLVVDYLLGKESGSDYMQKIIDSNVEYNQFNLLTIDYGTQGFETNYMNDKSNTSQVLQSGIYGLGNSYIDKPFEKVKNGKIKFEEVIKTFGNKNSEDRLLEELFAMMRNKEKNYPDEQIKHQGQGYDDAFLEGLSSKWVSCPAVNYGTRTTTAILVDKRNNVVYKEQTIREPITINDIKWDVNTFSFEL